MSWRKAWFLSSERIDEVRDEIFLGGASFDGLGFVFDDDFVIGNFNNFVAGNGEARFGKVPEKGAINNELLDHETVRIECKVVDFAEARTLFGDDFLAGESEVKCESFFYLDNVATGDELVDAVDDHAVARIFADTRDVENVGGWAISSDKADDF